MKYTFTCRDDFGAEVFMSLDTVDASHEEVTRFYCQFLRALGFYIHYGDNHDINTLFDLEEGEEEVEDESYDEEDEE